MKRISKVVLAKQTDEASTGRGQMGSALVDRNNSHMYDNIKTNDIDSNDNNRHNQ